MTRKIPTSLVEKNMYKNYLKKALEFIDSMNEAISSKNWNAASLTAIHAGISANDAVLVFHHGKRSISSKHDDCVKLLRSLMSNEDAKRAANHLSKLIYAKNIVEYESRLFKQGEAYSLAGHAEKFILWVKKKLPED